MVWRVAYEVVVEPSCSSMKNVRSLPFFYTNHNHVVDLDNLVALEDKDIIY